MIQPGLYDITIQRRGDFDIAFQLKDSEGVGLVLTGSTVQAQLWTAGRREKLFDFSVAITDQNTGKIIISLTEAQTETLPDTCFYDVMVTDTLGKSYYWVRGIATVEMGYTA